MRVRSRARIERSLLGSGLLHLLLLLAILFLMMPHPPQQPGSSNPVTVIFEPSLPSSPKNQPEGRPAASAPEEGPQTPPVAGNEGNQPPAPPPTQPPAPAAEAPPAPPMPVPPIPETPPPAPVPVTPPIPAPPPPPQETTAEPSPTQPPPPAAVTPPRPPIPQPRPAAPPRPVAPPHPRVETQHAPSLAEPSLSAPMNFSFGGATADPMRTRPTGRRNTINPTYGPDIANQVGAPPTDTHRPDASIKVSGAQVGSDWIAMLHAWWNQHSYYPQQAAQNGEDGIVRLHVVVDRYGKVLGVELVGKSGSQWLDLGAQAVFRGATLPPFPPATPESQANLDLTIQYLIYRR